MRRRPNLAPRSIPRQSTRGSARDRTAGDASRVLALALLMVLLTAAAPALAVAAQATGGEVSPDVAPRPFDELFAELGEPVQRVVVTGVTVYAVENLFPFAIAHEMTTMGRTSVAGTAEAIELIYREDGYLLTEVFAKFDRASRTVTFEVHEGYIGRIQIDGLRPRTAERVRSYFARLIGRQPLRQSEFERALTLANDLTGLSMRSEFEYESGREGALLRLMGQEWRQSGSFTADNVPLRPGNAGRAYVIQELYSIFAVGDLFRGVGVATLDPEETDAFSLTGTVYYRVPVGPQGTYIEAYAGNAFSRQPFSDPSPDATQRGINAALAVGHPVLRDTHRYAYVLGEYEYADAQSSIGDTDISSIVHALRVYYARGSSTDNGGTRRVSLGLSGGVRPDRSRGQPPDGDESFVDLRMSLALIQPITAISDRVFARFEAVAQVTPNSLPEVEKFAIGHDPYLRGYALAEVEGDIGVAGSLGIRRVADVRPGALSPFAFIDVGYVHNKRPAPPVAPSDKTLASVGAGVEITLGWGVSVTGWLAFPLVDGPRSDAGDPVFYVRLTKGW